MKYSNCLNNLLWDIGSIGDLRGVVIHMNKMPLDEDLIILFSKVFNFTETSPEVRYRIVTTVILLLRHMELLEEEGKNPVNFEGFFKRIGNDYTFAKNIKEFHRCTKFAIFKHKLDMSKQHPVRRSINPSIENNMYFIKYVQDVPIVYNDPYKYDDIDIAGYKCNNYFIPLFCNYTVPVSCKILNALNCLTTIESENALLSQLKSFNMNILFYTDKNYPISFESMVMSGLDYATYLVPKVEVYQGSNLIETLNVSLPSLFVKALIEFNRQVTIKNTKIGLFANIIS